MKRYRIEYFRPFPGEDDIELEAVEDEAGPWVPAEVAQELYNALSVMVECYGDADFISTEEREADPDMKAAREALAKAEGRE